MGCHKLTYHSNKTSEIPVSKYCYLGNILNVVTDRKLPVADANDNTKVAYFTADVVSYSDYLPFGQVMPNRHGDDNQYRFGYQGSERDNEVKGEGNSYTTLFRQLDPRIGRWMSIDPVTQPWQSPYTSMDNNPIIGNDVLGNYTKFKDKQAEKDFNTAHDKVKNKITQLNKVKNEITDKLKGELTKREIKQANKDLSKINLELEEWSKLKTDFDNIISSPVEFLYSSDISHLKKGLDGETVDSNNDYLTKNSEGKIIGGRVSIFVKGGLDMIVIHENRHGNQQIEEKNLNKLEKEKEAYNYQKIYNYKSVQQFIDAQTYLRYGHIQESIRPTLDLEGAIKYFYELE